MVTKATVQKVISNEELKVLVHAYDSVEEGPDEDDLPSVQTARINCPPGFIPDFRVGDVVYICIEDNNLNYPMVMGKLLLDRCKEDTVGTSRATLSKLSVTGSTELSATTKIGDVTAENIKCLKGASSNIQTQLNINLSNEVTLLDTLTTKLNNFSSRINPRKIGG